MKHRFRLAAAVLTALLFLTLTGCGSGSNSFTWFVDTIPANLDPQVASAASDVIACENLYSGLVRKDASGKLVPALAEHWEVSPDRRTYTFTLKSGLTYAATKGAATDYAITAEDFVFAFRRMFRADTASPYAVEFSPIENSAAVLAGQLPETALGVQAQGDATLVFCLSEPDENFLSKLTLPGAMPCDEDFEKWDTNVRKDFLRKWYHTRSKRVQTVSLEECMEDEDSKIHALPAPDGDFTEQVEGEDVYKRFKATLSEKDMAILELRVDGYGYQEIADRLGYKTHSAVVKRMEAIKKRFIQYENETGR